jgi:transporter family-2 protein
MQKLEPGLAFGLIAAGQMIISVVPEHFNVVAAEPQPNSFSGVSGILLILGAVTMARVF